MEADNLTDVRPRQIRNVPSLVEAYDDVVSRLREQGKGPDQTLELESVEDIPGLQALVGVAAADLDRTSEGRPTIRLKVERQQPPVEDKTRSSSIRATARESKFS